MVEDYYICFEQFQMKLEIHVLVFRRKLETKYRITSGSNMNTYRGGRYTQISYRSQFCAVFHPTMLSSGSNDRLFETIDHI